MISNAPELLAPAGNMECLCTAFDFGADAVYVAGQSFGLRASAPNFSDDDLREAVRFAHSLGRKLFVAVNAIVREDELGALRAYLRTLGSIEPDAIIFSDPAVLGTARELCPDIPMHLSTQASTMNSEACRFWAANGVKRIILARETTLDDIAKIRCALPSDIELEVFAHGAMCIAYSGRCLLSSVATGRSGNRGACAQPCRWEYEIREAGTEDEWMHAVEDASGTYILNSRDLMMADRIPELAAAGIDSLKIEGRMKSAYYVASVVGAYRKAIDEYLRSGSRASPQLMEELEKSATRSYTRGFFYGNPGAEGQDTIRKSTPRRYSFVGRVLRSTRDGYLEVEQRNKFSLGETLEVLSPGLDARSFVVDEILTLDGEARQSAPHAQERLFVRCPGAVRSGALLRRLDMPDTAQATEERE